MSLSFPKCLHVCLKVSLFASQYERCSRDNVIELIQEINKYKQYNYVNMRNNLLSCVLILSRISGPSFLVLTKYYLWVSGGEAVAGQQSWPAPSSCYHALSVTLSDIISYINISSYFICVHPQIVLYRWLVAAEIL